MFSNREYCIGRISDVPWSVLLAISVRVIMYIVVVNLASRPPQFLGSASSAPEGLGSQIGANLVRD